MPGINDVHAIDLFCGAGGLTNGLIRGGIHVVAGFDSDALCRYPYEINNQTRFINVDVTKLHGNEIKKIFPASSVRLLAGCAPCQPFSPLGRTRVRKTRDNKLLLHFAKIVHKVRPDLVLMENVTNVRSGREYAYFESTLRKLGYAISILEINAHDYDVPQSRKRLVVLASIFGSLDAWVPRKPTDERPFVEDAIKEHLDSLRAGESSSKDPLHTAKNLSPLNLRRVQASIQGGTWHDWPRNLLLRCHKKKSGRRYLAVYGRMAWSSPAPTITTEFSNLGSGRFGHPEQDRAITPREAALLQSFQMDYDFLQPGVAFSHERLGRWIGNAFPVKAAEFLSETIRSHVNDYA